MVWTQNLLTTLVKWPQNSKNHSFNRDRTLYLHKPMDSWGHNLSTWYLHCKSDFQPLLWSSAFNTVNTLKYSICCCSVIFMCWLSCSLWHLLFPSLIYSSSVSLWPPSLSYLFHYAIKPLFEQLSTKLTVFCWKTKQILVCCFPFFLLI